MKKLLISHIDLDGMGPLVLMKYFNLQFDDIMILDYRDRDDEEKFLEMTKDFGEIYMVDFSPTENEATIFLDEGKKVFVWDHHESSKFLKEMKHDNLYVVHDTTRCGTKIFFEDYVCSRFKRMKPILFEFVELVNCYDLYKSTDSLWGEAQNLNRVMYRSLNYGQSGLPLYIDFIGKVLYKIQTEEKWKWNSSEMTIITNDKKKEDQYFEKSKQILQIREDEKGVKFGLFHQRAKISIVCLRLLQTFKDIKYIICINTYEGTDCGAWKKMSIRSRSEDEFNCTQLAECEGHICAAARGCEEEFSKDLWNGNIWSLKYKE